MRRPPRAESRRRRGAASNEHMNGARRLDLDDAGSETLMELAGKGPCDMCYEAMRNRIGFDGWSVSAAAMIAFESSP